jgi:DNA-binding FadR family transcriptional regulator
VKDEKRDSLVVRTARTLAAMSMAVQDGAPLGSEGDLLEKLGISRPTLRQAAKIVEADRLIAVRRGTRGGVFATRPSAADAIRGPAQFLRLSGASLAQVHAVSRLVLEEAAAEAAGCADESLRRALRTFRARLDAEDAAGDTAARAIQRETEFAHVICRMSGNPAIALFVEISYTFGFLSAHLDLCATQADRRANREGLRGVCEAVLARDVEAARSMMRRRAETMADWIARMGAAGRAAE